MCQPIFIIFSRHIQRVSKNCADLFLSELGQISTDFNNFWQVDGKMSEILRVFNSHLTWSVLPHCLVKRRSPKFAGSRYYEGHLLAQTGKARTSGAVLRCGRGHVPSLRFTCCPQIQKLAGKIFKRHISNIGLYGVRIFGVGERIKWTRWWRCWWGNAPTQNLG